MNAVTTNKNSGVVQLRSAATGIVLLIIVESGDRTSLAPQFSQLDGVVMELTLQVANSILALCIGIQAVVKLAANPLQVGHQIGNAILQRLVLGTKFLSGLQFRSQVLNNGMLLVPFARRICQLSDRAIVLLSLRGKLLAKILQCSGLRFNLIL